MATTRERLYKPLTLKVWFAASSVLMLSAIVWWLAVDHDRPWRKFQDDYFAAKATLAHLDYLDATAQSHLDQIEDARSRLRDAEEYTQQTSGRVIDRLRNDMAEASAASRLAEKQWIRATQVLAAARAEYERTIEDHGQDDELTRAALQRLEREEASTEAYQASKAEGEDAERELSAALRTHEAVVRSARSRLDELESVGPDALARDQAFRGVASDAGFLGG